MTITVGTSSAGTSRSLRDRLLVLGLGTAVVYGALSRGGFYADDGATVLMLVTMATAARVLLRRSVRRSVTVGAVALFGLAAWSVGSALLHGVAVAALPAAALICGVAAAAWTAATANLSAYAGQSVQLKVEAADAGTASLVEAAVDNVVITKS